MKIQTSHSKTRKNGSKHKKEENSSSNYKTSHTYSKQKLLTLIARKPALMQNITSFGGVTKSWRSAARKCSPDGKLRLPQLVQISDKNKHCHTTDHISFHKRVILLLDNKRKALSYRYPADPVQYLGHSHGYLVAMNANLHECFLWKPSCYGPDSSLWKDYRYYLPPWDINLPFQIATLSSQVEYYADYNVMVIIGISSPAFAFCRHVKTTMQKEWILEDCMIKDHYALDQRNMQFTNAIGFKGKFYALSLQGSLVVIEDIDSYFRITAVGASRATPSKVSRQYREFLVESDGEILLVFLISRKSIDHVEDVEVFRLDVVELLWVKLVNLGDRAVFLEDECCMAVTASKVGCRRNCIYFTHDRVNKWYLYEIYGDESDFTSI